MATDQKPLGHMMTVCVCPWRKLTRGTHRPTLVYHWIPGRIGNSGVKAGLIFCGPKDSRIQIMTCWRHTGLATMPARNLVAW